MEWNTAQGYRSDDPAGEAIAAALPKRPAPVVVDTVRAGNRRSLPRRRPDDGPAGSVASANVDDIKSGKRFDPCVVSWTREARRIVEDRRMAGRSLEELLDVVTCRRSDGREVTLAQLPLENTRVSFPKIRIWNCIVAINSRT